MSQVGALLVIFFHCCALTGVFVLFYEGCIVFGWRCVFHSLHIDV